MEREINTTHLIYSLSEIRAENAHFTHTNNVVQVQPFVKIC